MSAAPERPERTYRNFGSGVDPFGKHSTIPAREREARLATAPTVARPEDEPAGGAWDRLHAFGFVRHPEVEDAIA